VLARLSIFGHFFHKASGRLKRGEKIFEMGGKRGEGDWQERAEEVGDILENSSQ